MVFEHDHCHACCVRCQWQLVFEHDHSLTLTLRPPTTGRSQGHSPRLGRQPRGLAAGLQRAPRARVRRGAAPPAHLHAGQVRGAQPHPAAQGETCHVTATSCHVTDGHSARCSRRLCPTARRTKSRWRSRRGRPWFGSSPSRTRTWTSPSRAPRGERCRPRRGTRRTGAPSPPAPPHAQPRTLLFVMMCVMQPTNRGEPEHIGRRVPLCQDERAAAESSSFNPHATLIQPSARCRREQLPHFALRHCCAHSTLMQPSFNPHSTLIQPSFNVRCRPVDGEFVAGTDGDYTLCWDNTFSWWNVKTVFYHFKKRLPEKPVE